ncbi:MarR family transcriptional regulator [Pigmentiphaga kullae]|uniref:Transcriptional regulator n=1 Tax=Pigmentiphaga kullae TaxID=151784 RepID=A0A4V2F416_9BURK|nr:helix-turn-helix domain-containing protein [Pigmentiphaga kullae]RZS86037.1 hypothetical protein EV675_2071 [Pigmentiphaga kullae]
MPTKTDQILDMIAARPGIRSVEIAEEMAMEATAVSSLLKRLVDGGRLRAEQVTAPNGRKVTAYTMIGTFGDGSEVLVPRQLWSRVVGIPEKGPFSVGLASNGRLTLELGRKSMVLSAEQARQLVQYLDGINVEKILGPGSAA